MRRQIKSSLSIATEERLKRQKLYKERKAEHEKKILARRQKQKKAAYTAGGVLFFFLIIFIYGSMPLQGPIQFGICRTFLELELKFPQTLKMTYVEVFDKSLRMYYTYNDAFGSVKSEMLECDFRPFSMMNIESVKKNRKPLAQEKVDRFNKLVPIVVSSDPDLDVPPLPKGDLESLKRDE